MAHVLKPTKLTVRLSTSFGESYPSAEGRLPELG
jgi:hypothetical protein